MYNAGTGVWTNGSTFNIAREGNHFIVTGTLPYKAGDSIFPQAGNRFAVKLNKDGITSTSDLPSGNIVKVTNTDIEGGYNIADKTAFETDGSLIVYAKIASDSLSREREVMIAWSEADKFTKYTFDLSRCTLANA